MLGKLDCVSLKAANKLERSGKCLSDGILKLPGGKPRVFNRHSLCKAFRQSLVHCQGTGEVCVPSYKAC